MKRAGAEQGGGLKPRLQVVRVSHKELKTRVTAPTMDEMTLYLKFHEETTGVKAETEELVEDSLKEYFKGDKAFQEFKRRGGATQPAPGATRPAAAASPTG